MIRTLRVTACAVMCCLLLCMHGAAKAAQYRPSAIPTAPNEVLASADSISNTGIVFGSYGGSCTTGHFLWSQGGGLTDLTTDIEYRGAPNASGQIVGTGWTEGSGYFAVVREADGSIQHLAYLNSSDTWTEAMAVSDCGIVIGSSCSESSSCIVLWDLANGAVTQIAQGENGELRGGLGNAAISSTGYTAWTYVTNRRYPDGHTAAIPRSFRRSPSGVVTEFPTPLTGGDWFATDVADDGTVLVSSPPPSVSYLWNPDGTLTQPALDGVAALSDSGLMLGTLGTRDVVLGIDGSLSDLPLPEGATSMRVADINNRGEVVGWAEFPDPNGVRAIIWEPVPEPSAFVALACGLVGILTQARKRRN